MDEEFEDDDYAVEDDRFQNDDTDYGSSKTESSSQEMAMGGGKDETNSSENKEPTRPTARRKPGRKFRKSMAQVGADADRILRIRSGEKVGGCYVTFYPDVYKVSPGQIPFDWHLDPNDYDPEKFYTDLIKIFETTEYATDKALRNVFTNFLSFVTRLPRDTIDSILSSRENVGKWADTIADNIDKNDQSSLQIGVVGDADVEPKELGDEQNPGFQTFTSTEAFATGSEPSVKGKKKEASDCKEE